MGNTAILTEDLGKQYRIARKAERYFTVREALINAFSSPFRRFRSLGGKSGNHDDLFWALRDVCLEVKHGEVLGIIGKNGAGKSTLLKLISRVTEPSAGRALIYGRVGSLLEVGIGFHPELTGRENTYLHGSILGMRRAEIAKKFDEIVDFAGVERFLDTPVKRYSSGMYVRLAFAVAAHLDTEILLVDEVLAVGDAEFQKKCTSKMGNVASQGRTVLFVSHNLGLITSLCSRAVLLSDGRITAEGSPTDVVSEYLSSYSEISGQWMCADPRKAPGNDRVRIRAVRVICDGRVAGQVESDKELQIEVDFWNFLPGITKLCANIYVLTALGTVVLSTAATPAANAVQDQWFDKPHPPGLYRSRCTFPPHFFNDAIYYINIYMVTLGPLNLEARAEGLLSFRVIDSGTMRQPGAGRDWHGVIRMRFPWHTEFVQPVDGECLVQ